VKHGSGIVLVVGVLASQPLTEAGEVCMVPMRDGVPLATEFFLPSGAGGPYPVVFARSVYGRGAGEGLAPLFNATGIAFVVQDTRGRGDSEGLDRVFADDGWGERQDGLDSVRWIREQEWCNGRVATWGLSALGIVQVLMAGAGADLQAQTIGVACSEFYGQLSYQGGVFRKHLCEEWVKGQGSEYVLDEWRKHPYLDDFWRGYDSGLRAEYVTAPGLHMGGWWDIFAQGTIDAFVSRQERGGPGARGHQRLIMGPWVHGIQREVGDLVLAQNFNAVDINAESARFLGHYLKGPADAGPVDGPVVQYYTLGACGEEGAPGNEWHTADTWPPSPTVETPLYLGPDAALSWERPAADASYAYRYDPLDPCPTHGGANLILPAGPFDQARLAQREDVLLFLTAPLDKPLTITGRVALRVHVSTDAPDTDITAKLLDVYPDGRQILMLDGIRRLKLRNGYESAEPVAANTAVSLEIDLWSISLVFNRGHRIGVQVSSSNYPRFERNPNTGDDFPDGETWRTAEVRVLSGPRYPSALLLPVVDTVP
jgi:predicted acyl esterase